MKLIFIGVCLPTFDLEISSTSHLMKFTHEQSKDHNTSVIIILSTLMFETVVTPGMCAWIKLKDVINVSHYAIWHVCKSFGVSNASTFFGMNLF